MLKIVRDDADRDDLAATLNGLVAAGERRMLMAGLESEVADYIEPPSRTWSVLGLVETAHLTLECVGLVAVDGLVFDWCAHSNAGVASLTVAKDDKGTRRSQWEAICSVAEKLGPAAETIEGLRMYGPILEEGALAASKAGSFIDPPGTPPTAGT